MASRTKGRLEEEIWDSRGMPSGVAQPPVKEIPTSLGSDACGVVFFMVFARLPDVSSRHFAFGFLCLCICVCM